MNEERLKMTICPLHRDVYGVRWRSNKTLCSIPEDLAAHKSPSARAQCGLTVLLSRYVLHETKLLIPVGTGRCVYLLLFNLEQK